MKSFKNKIAVVTGGASGMGYELVRGLVKASCHVAVCDLAADELQEVQAQCQAQAPDVRVTIHQCDVSVEADVNRFKEEVAAAHSTDQINLLFNNAGIGGGGGFVSGDRGDWERTFNVCWFGVYYCCRAFVPMVVASDEGYIVNTSSVNGFWASIGPTTPHTAYSAAKFAVKGFSEALIADLRMNAPHVKVAVVMPGHIATGIVENSNRILGHAPEQMSVEEIGEARQQMAASGLPVSNMPDDDIRRMITARLQVFQATAPTSSEQAAERILSAVQAGEWRILVGDDAVFIDALVRSSPGDAYEPEYVEKVTRTGHFAGLVRALE